MQPLRQRFDLNNGVTLNDKLRDKTSSIAKVGLLRIG